MNQAIAIVYQDVIYGLGLTREDAIEDAHSALADMVSMVGTPTFVPITDRDFHRIANTMFFDTMSAKDLLANVRTVED